MSEIAVVPAKAGTQLFSSSSKLGPGLRWDDEDGAIAVFCKADVPISQSS